VNRLKHPGCVFREPHWDGGETFRQKRTVQCWNFASGNTSADASSRPAHLSPITN
jgi:hypothetical protein